MILSDPTSSMPAPPQPRMSIVAEIVLFDSSVEVICDASLLQQFLQRQSVQAWNAWMNTLFELNLVCPVWRAHEQPPPCFFSFDFRDDDLSELDLDGVDLSAADLTGVNLTGSSLKYATIRWAPAAVFRGADLAGAKFVVAEISATDFSGARLDGVIFDDVRFNTALPPKGLPSHLLSRCLAEVEDA